MKEKIKVYAAFTVVAFGLLIAVYFFLKYLLGVLLPFLLGWGVAVLMRRPAEALGRRVRIPASVLRLVLATALTALLLTALFFGVKGLVGEVGGLLSRLESGELALGTALTAILTRFPFLEGLFPNTEALFSRIGEELLTALPRVVSWLVSALPAIFLGGIFSLIATVYFCLDLDKVHAAVRRLLPQGLREGAMGLKRDLLAVVLTVVRTEVLLMLIAFGAMLFGFLLLGIRYPLLLSALFALFDLLPAVGVGLILFPWGIWLVITGEFATGVGILVLATLLAVTRQFIEPRLLGARYEVHPLLTLLAMYAGAYLFGGWGLLLAPMLLLLLRAVLFGRGQEQTKKSDG